MRRRIGTALSVVSLLAVGTAAAAVNVRLLNGSGAGASLTSFEVQADAQSLRNANAAIGSAQPLAATTSAAAASSASPSASPTASATPTALGSVGSVPGGRLEGDHEGRLPHTEPGEHPERPQLTEAQLTLLRVSAMLRIRPEDVRAVARGEITNADMVAAVQRAADAVGTTLSQLASVEVPERHHERGHGGDGDRTRPGEGNGTGTLAPVTTTTNDD